MLIHRQPTARWLIRFLKPLLLYHVAAIGCMSAASITALFDPLILRWVFDTVLPEKRIWLLPVAVIGVLGVSSGTLVLHSVGDLFGFVAGRKFLFKVRLNLLRHLQSLSMDYHTRVPVGEQLYLLEQDGERLGEMAGLSMAKIFFDGLFILSIIAVMLVLNRFIALIVVAVVPFYFWAGQRARKRLAQSHAAAQEAESNRAVFLEEHLAAILQVKLLSMERREAGKFLRLARTVLKEEFHSKVCELKLSNVTWFLISLAMAMTLGWGGLQVITGRLTIGSLIALYSYALRIFAPIQEMQNVYSQMLKGAASLRRLVELSEVSPSVRASRTAVRIPSGNPGSITFTNVCFGYRNGDNLLEGVTFSIEAGDTVALMGASGAGKSTIAKLVARLYDPLSGTVHIGHFDLRDLTTRGVRQAVTLLPQEPIVFNTTIRENILYGREGAAESEIAELIEVVQLEQLIRRFPAGIEQHTGARGSILSGGERQRIAIARALLRRPKILILDEATSALDLDTEARLLKRLRTYAHNTTIVLISHRQSATSWARRTLIIKNKKVKEQNAGPPEEDWNEVPQYA